MAQSVHRFRVAEARRYRHPVFSKIEKHHFAVRALDVPKGISSEPNARDAVGINRQVYRDVRDSLLGQTAIPGTFDLMNKGITILASEVRRIDDSNYEVVIGEGEGIVDGGHTYRIITENQGSPELPPEQYVDVLIRTGVDDGLITDIARGLNTGIQVKAHSLSNLEGAFDWLKEEIKDEPYAPIISFREGDEGDYDVRDLISILEALNVFDFPNDIGVHPIHAYEKWSTPAKKFADDYEKNRGDLRKSTYHRLRPILKGGLIMFDTIRAEFREIHNDVAEGKAGNMRILEKAREGKPFVFPFAGLPAAEYRLTKGALYPMLAAFRNAVVVDPGTGQAQWFGGFKTVKKLWKESQADLVGETYNATKDIGRLPDQLGKNRGHWANLHKTLEVRILRKQLAAK